MPRFVPSPVFLEKHNMPLQLHDLAAGFLKPNLTESDSELFNSDTEPVTFLNASNPDMMSKASHPSSLYPDQEDCSSVRPRHLPSAQTKPFETNMSQFTQNQASASPALLDIEETVADLAIVDKRPRGRRGGRKTQATRQALDELHAQGQFLVKPSRTLLKVGPICLKSAQVSSPYIASETQTERLDTTVCDTVSDFATLSKVTRHRANKQLKPGVASITPAQASARQEAFENEQCRIDRLKTRSHIVVDAKSSTVTVVSKTVVPFNLREMCDAFINDQDDVQDPELPFYHTHEHDQSLIGQKITHRHDCYVCGDEFIHTHTIKTETESRKIQPLFTCHNCAVRQSFLVAAPPAPAKLDSRPRQTYEPPVVHNLNDDEQLIEFQMDLNDPNFNLDDYLVAVEAALDEVLNIQADSPESSDAESVSTDDTDMSFHLDTWDTEDVISDESDLDDIVTPHFTGEVIPLHDYNSLTEDCALQFNPPVRALRLARATHYLMPYAPGKIYDIRPPVTNRLGYNAPIFEIRQGLAFRTIWPDIYTGLNIQPIIANVPSAPLFCREEHFEPCRPVFIEDERYPFSVITCQLPPELRDGALRTSHVRVCTTELGLHGPCPLHARCPHDTAACECVYCASTTDTDLNTAAAVQHWFNVTYIHRSGIHYDDIQRMINDFHLVMRNRSADPAALRQWTDDLIHTIFGPSAKGAAASSAKNMWNKVSNFLDLTNTIHSVFTTITEKYEHFVELLDIPTWQNFITLLLINLLLAIGCLAYAYYGKTFDKIMLLLTCVTVGACALTTRAACNIQYTEIFDKYLPEILGMAEELETPMDNARYAWDHRNSVALGMNQEFAENVKLSHGILNNEVRTRATVRETQLREIELACDSRNCSMSQRASHLRLPYNFATADLESYLSRCHPTAVNPSIITPPPMSVPEDFLKVKDDEQFYLAPDAKMFTAKNLYTAFSTEQQMSAFDFKRLTASHQTAGIYAAEQIGMPDATAPSADAKFSSSCSSIYNILAQFMGVKGGLTLVALNAAFMFGRNIKGVLSFIFNLTPLVMQRYLAEKCPSIATWLDWTGGPWFEIDAAIHSTIAALAEPDADTIRNARLLLTRAEKLHSSQIASKWAAYAYARIKKLDEALRAAETRLFVATDGKSPFSDVLAGQTGIGKSRITEIKAEIIASKVAGTHTAYGVYNRPLGDYCDGLTNQKVIVYPDLGAGTTDTTAVQMEEWNAVCDSNFKPNHSAVEQKGMVHAIAAAFQTTNYFHLQNQHFSNTNAFHRRYHVCAIAYPDEMFLKNFWRANSNDPFPPTTSMLRYFLKHGSAEDVRESKHLRFRLTPRALEAWRGETKSQIWSYDLQTSAESMAQWPEWRYDKEYFVERRLDTNKLSTRDYINYVIYAFEQHQARNGPIVQEARTFVASFLKPEEQMNLDPPQPPVASKYYDMYRLVGCLASAAGIAATAYGIYRLFKSQAAEAKGEEAESSDAKYISRRRELLPRKERSAPAKGARDEYQEISSKIFDHQCRIELIRGDKTNRINGLFISSREILTNAHILIDPKTGVPIYDEAIRVIFEANETPCEHNDRTSPDRVCYFQGDYTSDLCIITLTKPIRGMSQKLLSYFTVDQPQDNSQAPLEVFTHEKLVAGIYMNGFSGTSYNDPDLRNLRPRQGFRFKGYLDYGTCGSAIICRLEGKWQIIGIVCAGFVSEQYGLTVPKAWLSDVVRTQNAPKLQPCTDLPNAYSDMQPTTNDLPRQPEGNFYPIARIKCPDGEGSGTALKPTPFLNADPDRPCRVAPAQLKFSLTEKQEAKHGVPRRQLPNADLDFGVQIANSYMPKVKEKLEPYTFDEVANLIELDKSTGFRMRKQRKSYMYQDEDKVWHFKPEFIEQVYELEKSEIWPCTIIKPSLKDETLKMQKVVDGLTRTFEISTFVYLVYGVRWLGPFIDLLHLDHSSASAVGIDPCSRDWDYMIRRLEAKRLKSVFRLLTLDYKKMESLVTWAEAQHYADYIRTVVNDPDNNVSKYVFAMIDCAYAIGNSLYGGFTGNKSGMVGTVDINTYTNLIFIGAAYRHIFGNRATVENFHKFVELVLYGDDTLLTTTPDLDPHFNFFTVQTYLADYGIHITPAVKDAEPTAHTEQPEADFLKKRILWSAQLRSYVPYVTYHTLLDQLSYARDVSFEGLEQIINSALAFGFFRGTWKQNGQIPEDDPTFEEMRDTFIYIAAVNPAKIVTYDQLLHRYEQFSVKTAETLPTRQAPSSNAKSSTTDNNEMSDYIQHQAARAHAAIIAEPANAKGNSTSTQQNFYGSNNNATSTSSASQAITPSLSVAAGTGGQNASLEKNAAPEPTAKVKGPAPPANAKMERLIRPSDGTTSMLQMTPIPVTNGVQIRSTIDGHDHAMNLTDHAATELDVDSSDLGIEADEMTHSFFRNKMSLLGITAIPYATVAGDLIASVPITPFQYFRHGFSQINIPLFLTVLEWFASLYYWWKGSIKMTLQIIAPRELSGRLAIVYGYGLSAAPPYADAIRAGVINFDFDAENREITFIVPYVNARCERMSCPLRGTFSATTPEYDPNGIGNVYIYSATTLAGSNAIYSRPPELNIYIGGGPDFRVFKLSPLASMGYDQAIPPTDARLDDDSDDSSVEIVSPPPSVKNRRLKPSAKMLSANTIFHADTTKGQVTARRVQRKGEPVENSLIGFAAKFDVITTQTIQTTTTNVAKFNFPSDLLTVQAQYAKSASTFFTGDVVLRIKPVAAGWLGGSIIAAFVPFKNKAATDYPASRLTQLPHVVLDLASDAGVELVIPFISQETYWYDGCPDVGSIHVLMLNQLQTPSTGTSKQDVVIEAAWINFKTYIPAPISTSLLSEKPHAPPASAKSDRADDAHAVTDNAHQTSTELDTAIPITAVAAPTESREYESDFKRDMHRLAPSRLYAFNLVMSHMDLDVTFAGLAHHLSRIYAGFRGSMIVQCLLQSNAIDLQTVFATKNAPPGATWDTFLLEAGGQTDLVTQQPGQQFAHSNPPITRASGNHQNVRLRLHMETATRWVATQPNTTLAYGNAPFGRGKLTFLQSSIGAETDGRMIVYTAPSEEARFFHFIGIPPVYMNPAIEPTTSVETNYKGEYLAI
jgi:hypothetical protein